MINEKPVMTKFANSVSDLCRRIDLRIDYKDYTGARCLVSDMEAFLKKIVSAMLLHGDIIDTREADMIMTFIRRIVEDKRMIIMKSEKILYLESKEDDSFFEQEEANWKEYITPPFDKEYHQRDSNDSKAINNRWRDDDDEDDL